MFSFNAERFLFRAKLHFFFDVTIIPARFYQHVITF